jgi:hypothetical protein
MPDWQEIFGRKDRSAGGAFFALGSSGFEELPCDLEGDKVLPVPVAKVRRKRCFFAATASITRSIAYPDSTARMRAALVFVRNIVKASRHASSFSYVIFQRLFRGVDTWRFRLPSVSMSMA